MDRTDQDEDALRREVVELRARLAELENDECDRRRAEDLLGESDEALLQMTERTRDVFWLTDWQNNAVLYVSPSYESLWGRSRRSLYEDPRSWAEPIHPDDRARVFDAFKRDAPEGQYDIEYRILHQDGSERWIHDRAFPLRDRDGRVRRIAGISEDITELKHGGKIQLQQLRRLRRRQEAVVQIATHPAVVAGDFAAAAQLITETVADILDLDRVGVWLLSSDGSELVCAELYERVPERHSKGTVLEARSYPHYFEALRSCRVIDADDARGDPRTSEFTEGYLDELGIYSMLDAVIRVGGESVGVVCHEHVGESRHWRSDEVAFTGEVADQLAQTLLNRDRSRKADALQESEERLVEAQRIANLGSWELNFEDGSVWYSDELFRLFGHEPGAFVPTYEGFMEHVPTEDRTVIEDGLARTRESDELFAVEFHYRLPDGDLRTFQARARLRHRKGEGPPRLLGTCLDITERLRAEQRQRMMVQELDHRVKNVLATVVAIARRTQESAEDLTSFWEAFDGRISSMARVHEALARRSWEGANLRDLLEGILAPYGGEGRQLALNGEDLLLPYDAVTPLARALHELVTNAAKYGALSVPEGHIVVSWDVHRGAGGTRLDLRWAESEGPSVAVPTHTGFGSSLIQQGIEYELGGTVQLDFEPAGLLCTVVFALPERDGESGTRQ